MTATGGTQSVNLFVKTRAHVVHLLHTRRQRSAGAWVGMLHPRVQAFHCASFACTIKGFKSIASVDKLELRAINVVIGANGSGKSNFIGAFSFLHEIREGRLNEYVRTAGGW